MLVAFIIVPLTFCGCRTRTSDRDLAFVNPAEGTQVVNSTGRGMNLFGSARGANWVDCRPSADFQTSRIPGAINVPYQRLTEQREALDRYVTIIVYGSDYNDPRAIGMSKRLLEWGYDARTLRGGMRAWIDAGRATESGPVAED